MIIITITRTSRNLFENTFVITEVFKFITCQVSKGLYFDGHVHSNFGLTLHIHGRTKMAAVFALYD